MLMRQLLSKQNFDSQAADFVLRELIRFEMADVSRREDDPKV